MSVQFSFLILIKVSDCLSLERQKIGGFASISLVNLLYIDSIQMILIQYINLPRMTLSMQGCII